MMTVRVSIRTIDALVNVICGGSVSPYRTAIKLEEFFTEQLGLAVPPGLQRGSRPKETASWLKHLNGAPDLARAIQEAVRPGDYEGTDFPVEAAVEYLAPFLFFDDLQLVRHGKRYKLSTTRIDVTAPSAPSLSMAYVRELVDKADGRLAEGDNEGAISAARTLVEAVLNELETRLEGACGKYDDLPKQFRAVAKKLRIDAERPDLDDNFKQVVRGLIQVVDGLAPIRNKASDAHARVRKPEAHHAHLVVNAAKTLATFLVESFVMQRERGLLPPAPGSSA